MHATKFQFRTINKDSNNQAPPRIISAPSSLIVYVNSIASSPSSAAFSSMRSSSSVFMLLDEWKSKTTAKHGIPEKIMFKLANKTIFR